MALTLLMMAGGIKSFILAVLSTVGSPGACGGDGGCAGGGSTVTRKGRSGAC